MKLSIERVQQDKKELLHCGDTYVEIYQKFMDIVNQLRQEGILSSNQLNQTMEGILSDMKKVSEKLRENCGSFADFLENSVVEQTQRIDQEANKLFDLEKGERL